MYTYVWLGDIRLNQIEYRSVILLFCKLEKLEKEETQGKMEEFFQIKHLGDN